MNSEEAQQEELNEAQEQPEYGPGHLLAKKREALGMSVQEVADTLHITMHFVRALEADDHDKLPNDVFIKGYLRSYAGLLHLDPTVIVNVYLDYTGTQASPVAQSGTRRKPINRRRISWLVVSGVAFVGVAITLWLFSSGSAEPERPAPSAADTPNVTTRTLRPGVAATIDQVATSIAVPSVTEQALAQPEPSPAGELQAVLTDAPDDGESTPVQLTPTQDETQGQADTVPLEDAAQGGATLERLISVDGGGEDLVQFTFTGQSMVQVTDANDEQLYRDVRVAGDLLRISGTAPFNILLGDASNSALSFNGAMVDFSSSIRIDNSARLTIGL